MQRVATRKEDNEHSVEWEIEDAGEQPLRPTTPLHLEGKTFDNAVLNPKAPIRGWTLRQDFEEDFASGSSEYGEECSMSLGWLCFILGFVFILPWAVGMLLPLCSPSKNDKWAGYWNTLATVISGILFTSIYLSYPE